MKIVLDTNVFISGLLWQKFVREIFYLSRNNKIEICVSREIIEEFQEVLKYPKITDKLKQINKTPEDVINEFLEVVKLYPLPRGSKSPIIKEDPSDDKFLLCALFSGARFVISGDKHLLSLKTYKNIKIVSPQEFLNIFKK